MATHAFWTFCWRVLARPLRRLTIFALQQANSDRPTTRRPEGASGDSRPASAGPPAHWLADIRARAPELLTDDGSLITSGSTTGSPPGAAIRPASGGGASRPAARVRPPTLTGDAGRTGRPAAGRRHPGRRVSARPVAGTGRNLWNFRMPDILAPWRTGTPPELAQPQATPAPAARRAGATGSGVPAAPRPTPATRWAGVRGTEPPHRPESERGISFEQGAWARATGRAGGALERGAAIPPQQAAPRAVTRADRVTAEGQPPALDPGLAETPERPPERGRPAPTGQRLPPPRDRAGGRTKPPPLAGRGVVPVGPQAESGGHEAVHPARPAESAPGWTRFATTAEAGRSPFSAARRGPVTAAPPLEMLVWPEVNQEEWVSRVSPPGPARRPRMAPQTTPSPPAGMAAIEQAGLRSPWPTLPDEDPLPGDDLAVALRAWERLQRLDREQRGLEWSA